MRATHNKEMRKRHVVYRISEMYDWLETKEKTGW